MGAARARAEYTAWNTQRSGSVWTSRRKRTPYAAPWVYWLWSTGEQKHAKLFPFDVDQDFQYHFCLFKKVFVSFSQIFASKNDWLTDNSFLVRKFEWTHKHSVHSNRWQGNYPFIVVSIFRNQPLYLQQLSGLEAEERKMQVQVNDRMILIFFGWKDNGQRSQGEHLKINIMQIYTIYYIFICNHRS